MPNGQTSLLRLKVLLITQHEMPFTNKCEAKKVDRPKFKKEGENVQMSRTLGICVI